MLKNGLFVTCARLPDLRDEVEEVRRVVGHTVVGPRLVLHVADVPLQALALWMGKEGLTRGRKG